MNRQPSLLDPADAVRRRLVHGGAQVWQFPTSSDRVVLLATLGHCRLVLVVFNALIIWQAWSWQA